MTKLEDWLRRYPMVAATLVVALAGLVLTLTAPAATRWVVGAYALVVAAMHASPVVVDGEVIAADVAVGKSGKARRNSGRKNAQ